ncbi:MAG: tetratricopeptide repeat protein [Massilia sp.]
MLTQSQHPFLEGLTKAIASYESGDILAASEQFMILAEQNCAESFLYLSLIFGEGDGVPKDELRSVRYKRRYVQIMEELAESGDPFYELQLGYILQYGDGTAIDLPRAFSAFRSAAEKGCGEAQFHLSRIFAHGQCDQKIDPERELMWLEEATRSQYPKALYYSALFLYGTDDPERRALMEQSAELGCWQAKQYLESAERETGVKYHPAS